MKSRTKARSIALQVLFESDISGHPPLLALQNRLVEAPISEIQSEFATQIINGVQPLIDKLDRMIEVHAPEWPLDQVSVIDRNIIRIALWEFAISKCTPVKVAINEAIELSKMFGSESTPRFVNGVLGSLADRINQTNPG